MCVQIEAGVKEIFHKQKDMSISNEPRATC